jgi:1,5-anhydro-D-fructose reductase (1,5-anhydro-D-mannitol-forming)
MVRTGLVGLGFMGQQHFAIHQAMANVKLLAVCDKLPERAAEHVEAVGGNIGEAQKLDLSSVARYTCFDELLKHEGLECVDICTPTHLHAEMTVKALEAGKHVICEKPMALNPADCQQMIDAAAANGKLLFIAQCIRFWPEYELLADWVKSGKLGRIVSAKFTRISPPPVWSEGKWLLDTSLSGGALLDLHIHDVDFIADCFGMPPAVSSRAANRVTEGPKVDHTFTQYLYPDFVCVAEGGWGMPGTVPFEMGYQVLGEAGLLRFSLATAPMLQFFPAEGDIQHPQVPAETGYQREFVHFMDCLEQGVASDRVTPQSAMNSVAVCMAETESANSGKVVCL